MKFTGSCLRNVGILKTDTRTPPTVVGTVNMNNKNSIHRLLGRAFETKQHAGNNTSTDKPLGNFGVRT